MHTEFWSERPLGRREHRGKDDNRKVSTGWLHLKWDKWLLASQ
jgi:hypothetical protein